MNRWNEDIDGMEKEHLDIQEILEADIPMEEIEIDEEICTCDIDETLCVLHNPDFNEDN